MFEAGLLLPSSVYLRAQRARRRMQQAVAAAFESEQLDALIAPTVPAAAQRCDQDEYELGGVAESVQNALVRTTAPTSPVFRPSPCRPAWTRRLPGSVSSLPAPSTRSPRCGSRERASPARLRSKRRGASSAHSPPRSERMPRRRNGTHLPRARWDRAAAGAVQPRDPVRRHRVHRGGGRLSRGQTGRRRRRPSCAGEVVWHNIRLRRSGGRHARGRQKITVFLKDVRHAPPRSACEGLSRRASTRSARSCRSRISDCLTCSWRSTRSRSAPRAGRRSWRASPDRRRS